MLHVVLVLLATSDKIALAQQPNECAPADALVAASDSALIQWAALHDRLVGYPSGGGQSVADGGENASQVSATTASADSLTMMLQKKVEDVVDIDAMVQNQERQAAKNVRYLKAKVHSLKPLLKKAKKKFKSKCKAIRKHFKTCKKKLKKKSKKWKSSSECRPFVDHFLAKKRAGQKNKEGKKKAGKRKKANNRAIRRERRDARCADRPVCNLRQAKRRARQAAKKEFQTTKKTFRDYKKELRKARFQKNILPKVIRLLKPQLLSALAEVDMGDGAKGVLRGCPPPPITDEEKEGCIPLDLITSVDLLRDFSTVKLNATLRPALDDVFAKLIEQIWKVLDPKVDKARSSIVALVGSIPLVGGSLAEGATSLMSNLYSDMKQGVESGLIAVKTALHQTLVRATVDSIFATELFTTQALQDPSQSQALSEQMAAASETASKAGITDSQNSLTSTAEAAKRQAEQDAENVLFDMVGDGERVAEEEESDDQEDADEDADEDRLDIDADEDW